MSRDSPDPNKQRDRILQGLRTHGTAFADLGRSLGTRMGLHTTDAAALIEILEAQDRGTPLTQTQLSHRIGLTPGATSSLLNRLEAAGHVRRARDSTDRRLVTLHSTDGVEAQIDRFFDPLSERIGVALQHYSPQMLDEFEQFLTELGATMNSYIKEASAEQDPTKT